MDDKQVMHAMSLDDMYHVEKTLARGADGVTELVTVDGAGPFVRKKMSIALANRGVWSILLACNCARLPKVEATYELPEQFVVVYDFIPGETLERLVSEHGHLDESVACARALEVCEAASALHALGVIHRDISPKNIVVAADGAHLIDLGIARMRVEGASRDTTSLGTWGYASPEQYGFAQTDARSDVYSIGRVLGFMLTGIQPDSEGYECALCNEGCVSPRMRAVIERSCAFEPSKRYQSVEELARALGRAGDAAVVAPLGPQPLPEPASAAPRTSRSWRKAGIVCACVTAVASMAAMGMIALHGRDVSPSDDEAVAASAVVSGDMAPASSVSAAGDNLQLFDTGWSVDQNGCLVAVFGLKNTSTNAEIDLPGVRVTATGSDGGVLFTEEQYAFALLPGATSYCSVLGETGGKAPTKVDFELIQPDTGNVRPSGSECPMVATNVSAAPDGYGGTVFSGDVAVDAGEFKREFAGRCDSLAVTVVLRDEAGSPIYASTDYVTPSADGATTPFSIDVYGAPDYASYDVNVQPW